MAAGPHVARWTSSGSCWRAVCGGDGDLGGGKGEASYRMCEGMTSWLTS